jgi:raffinose/stachyose/melibiose transport system substrate-binding protein
VDNAKKVNAGGGTLSTVAGTDDAIPDALLKQVAENANKAKYFQVYYDQYLPPATGEAVKDATQALFIGKMTPEETAQTVEAAAASELKK